MVLIKDRHFGLNKIYKEIPKDFYWSLDHTKPETIQHKKVSKEELLSFFTRLETVKKAEILCGLTLDRDKVINMEADSLLKQIDNVFNVVTPLYKIAQNIK